MSAAFTRTSGTWVRTMFAMALSCQARTPRAETAKLPAAAAAPKKNCLRPTFMGVPLLQMGRGIKRECRQGQGRIRRCTGRKDGAAKDQQVAYLMVDQMPIHHTV